MNTLKKCKYRWLWVKGPLGGGEGLRGGPRNTPASFQRGGIEVSGVKEKSDFQE